MTPGQAYDLDGADVLLPEIKAESVLADKAYDADKRVIEVLKKKGIEVVIPPKNDRKEPCNYNRDLYIARHYS